MLVVNSVWWFPDQRCVPGLLGLVSSPDIGRPPGPFEHIDQCMRRGSELGQQADWDRLRPLTYCQLGAAWALTNTAQKAAPAAAKKRVLTIIVEKKNGSSKRVCVFDSWTEMYRDEVC